MKDYTLRLRKVGDNSTLRDVFEDFGIAVLEQPMLEATEEKEPAATDWLDEHGLDVFDNGETYFKDFDTTIAFGLYATTTNSCHQVYKAFLNYLTKNGRLHDMYSPWVETGRTKVRFKSASDFDFDRGDGLSFMTFKITFNIADPETEVAEF